MNLHLVLGLLSSLTIGGSSEPQEVKILSKTPMSESVSLRGSSNVIEVDQTYRKLSSHVVPQEWTDAVDPFRDNDVKWDDSIAVSAQSWAGYLYDKGCVVQLNDEDEYAENIYQQISFPPDGPVPPPEEVIEYWINDDETEYMGFLTMDLMGCGVANNIIAGGEYDGYRCFIAVCQYSKDLSECDISSTLTTKPQEWVDAHNEQREQFHNETDTGDMFAAWNATIATSAQDWADYLISDSGCEISLSNQTIYGQNIIGYSGCTNLKSGEIMEAWMGYNSSTISVLGAEYIGCGEASKNLSEGVNCFISVCQYSITY